MLVDEQLQKFAKGDWLRTRQFAWQMILESLANGTLPSRSLEPGSFRLSFVSSKETKVHEVGPEGIIPTIFWHYFCEAQAQEIQDPLVTLRASHAERDEANFRFQLNAGLKDGGILTGVAHAVVVQRKAVPGRLPRGRRPGKKYDDRAILQKTVIAMRGGMSRAEAVKTFALEMGGFGTPRSKEDRLRLRLRQAGDVENI